MVSGPCSARGDDFERASWDLGHGRVTHRNVGILAKMSAKIDHLSDGRAILGLGAEHPRGRKLPDLLIAAAAEAHGLPVLHYDTDFHRNSHLRRRADLHKF